MNARIIKGTKQIGGCITEISTSNTKIIIDFGEELDDNSKPFELEGLTKGKSIYDAVFITHSHKDHIGLIDTINEDIPIYVEEKTFEIHNLTCDYTNNKRAERLVNTFKIDDFKNQNSRIVFQNNEIKVSAYMGDHSAFNSVMYLIEGDGKRVLHTGDFRMHGRKSEIFKMSIKKIGKVDMLITEGTTLTRINNKFKTEQELENESINILEKYDQALVIQSSTNVDRLVSFTKAALRTNHKIVLDLFSRYVVETTEVPIIVDNKNIFTWKPQKYNNKPKWFKDKYMNIETSSKFFPNYLMFIKESMLEDIKLLKSKGSLKNACLIYSMWDGYIEKSNNLKGIMDYCKSIGIDIITLHTSGHADKEAMKMVNMVCNPNQTIIIHTENGQEGKDIFNNVVEVNDNEYILVI